MEMTCHPRLGGARPKGGRGSSESSAYLAILLYLFIFWNLRYKKNEDRATRGTEAGGPQA